MSLSRRGFAGMIGAGALAPSALLGFELLHRLRLAAQSSRFSSVSNSSSTLMLVFIQLPVLVGYVRVVLCITLLTQAEGKSLSRSLGCID